MYKMVNDMTPASAILLMVILALYIPVLFMLLPAKTIRMPKRAMHTINTDGYYQHMVPKHISKARTCREDKC